MDFKWSDQQQELFNAVDRFASQTFGDRNVIENDRNSVFDQEAWLACGDFGIQGLTVPEDQGGLGLDALTAVGALERLGYRCRDNGLLFSINAHLWTACMPLVAFGTQEQKQIFLPGLCSGKLIGGNAMSEPGSGSDAYSLRTTASKKGDCYVLNGNKIWVTNGPIADVLVVFATVDSSKGARGVTAFLVEKDTPGFIIANKLEKMGVRTSPMAEIILDQCEVPVENRLGGEGSGTSLFTHSMVWERGCILSSAVGSMRRLLERCLEHAKQRTQFGQAIGKFQMISTKIVDMKLRLESARHMLYHGAWLRTSGKTAVMETSMAKLHISDCWVRSCEDAMQIFGGSGYMTEFEIERELRDAMASKIYSGTSEIQRSLIAALMGL